MKKAPEAFRTISEVSDLLDTPAHVLRFWESKFYQIRPVKRAGGRRYYRPDDVALLAGIRLLLQDQGITIRGVQKVLQEQGVRHVASLAPEKVMQAMEHSGADEGPATASEAARDAGPETALHPLAPRPPEPRAPLPRAPLPFRARDEDEQRLPETLDHTGEEDAPVPEGYGTAPPHALPRAMAPGMTPDTQPDTQPDTHPDTHPRAREAMGGDEATRGDDASARPVAENAATQGAFGNDNGEEYGSKGAGTGAQDEPAPAPPQPVTPPPVTPPSVAASPGPGGRTAPAQATSPALPSAQPQGQAAARSGAQATAPDSAGLAPEVPGERTRLAQNLRHAPRNALTAHRGKAELLARRIDALLDRMSEASGAGRW